MSNIRKKRKLVKESYMINAQELQSTKEKLDLIMPATYNAVLLFAKNNKI